MPGGSFSLINVDVLGQSECRELAFAFKKKCAKPKRAFLGSFSLWNAGMTGQSEFYITNTRFVQNSLKLKAKRHLSKFALKAVGRPEKRKDSMHSLRPVTIPFESEKP